MNVKFNIHRLDRKPTSWVANDWYVIKKGSKYFDFYIVSSSGVPFLNSSGDVEIYQCGEQINSHTPVVLYQNKLFKLDCNNINHQFNFVGFTEYSGNAGDYVIVRGDIIQMNGWNLIPNINYLAGASGAMSISNTSNGFTKVIGYSQDSNTLLVYKNYTPILK